MVTHIHSKRNQRVKHYLQRALDRLMPEVGSAGGVNNPWWRPAQHCLLERLSQLLKHDVCDSSRAGSDPAVVEVVREQVGRCLTAGYTLRCQLPRVDGTLQREWLGERWLWMHAAHLTDHGPWVAWVSSRIGRDGRACNTWPTWLSLQVRDMLADATREPCWPKHYLYIPGTTLSPLAWPLVEQAQLPTVRVDLPRLREQLADWLCRMLGECGDSLLTNARRQTISLSPVLWPTCEAMESLPLQDRVAVAWADRIVALSLRDGGTTQRLLRARLNDTRFPAGSVMVAMEAGRKQLTWLDRGAVGWHLIPAADRLLSSIVTCRPQTQAEALFQCTLPLERWRCDGYLVHCVRGDQGRRDILPAAARTLDAWLTGQPRRSTAFETLLTIVEGRRVRGQPKLNRSERATVSLSEVPLGELLSKRRFQAHLGRWDWEPYGIAIRRDAIEKLGGRPVIYGDDAAYEQLLMDQRPFFQPERWQSEREWRMVGDIRLQDLPSEAVRLFVATRAEAEQLSRHAPWPVIICR